MKVQSKNYLFNFWIFTPKMSWNSYWDIFGIFQTLWKVFFHEAYGIRLHVLQHCHVVPDLFFLWTHKCHKMLGGAEALPRIMATAMHVIRGTLWQNPNFCSKITFSIITFLAGKFKFNVGVDFIKIEFLDKNWDFASVCEGVISKIQQIQPYSMYWGLITN